MQAAIRAETVNGDITVKGGEGLVSLNTVEGSVMLEDAKGRIDVESVNADVAVRNAEGEVRAETVNGGVTLAGVRSGERGGQHRQWRHALRRHHPRRAGVIAW